jgi:hypothetical protein
MKRNDYEDGTPSREWEDDDEDWETSVEEETARLYKKNRNTHGILECRDRLNDTNSLINVCTVLLNYEEYHTKVCLGDLAIVFIKFVMPEIKSIEQELSNV